MEQTPPQVAAGALRGDGAAAEEPPVEAKVFQKVVFFSGVLCFLFVGMLFIVVLVCFCVFLMGVFMQGFRMFRFDVFGWFSMWVFVQALFSFAFYGRFFSVFASPSSSIASFSPTSPLRMAATGSSGASDAGWTAGGCLGKGTRGLNKKVDILESLTSFLVVCVALISVFYKFVFTCFDPFG